MAFITVLISKFTAIISAILLLLGIGGVPGDDTKPQEPDVTDPSVVIEDDTEDQTEEPEIVIQEQVAEVRGTTLCRFVQGGCFDGTYVYIAFNDNGNGENSKSVIKKYDPVTWEEVQSSGEIHIYHANDMTYNQKTNRIVVSCGSPDAKKICVLDSQTLEVLSVKDIVRSVYAIEYYPEGNCYFAGFSNGTVGKLSLKFSRTDYIEAYDSGFTKQGMTRHGDYLYFLQYKKNCIQVYSISENRYLGQYNLPVTSGEPENIFVIDNTVYTVYSSTNWKYGIVYKLSMTQTIPTGSDYSCHANEEITKDNIQLANETPVV